MVAVEAVLARYDEIEAEMYERALAEQEEEEVSG